MVRGGVSTWILLRGWAREAGHWGDFPWQLREAIPGARVLPLDLPGNGELRAVASPLSVSGMVAECRRRWLARGEPAPWLVLGLSLGAMAAIEWACRHPHEIRGAVLINTSLRPFSTATRRLRPGSWLELARIAVAERGPQGREAAILRLTSASPAPGTLGSWTRIATERPVSRVNALRQLLAAARYRAPVRPAPPLLVLASARDRLVDPECSRTLARQWEASYAEHPAAGHDLPLDDGAWVARETARWAQALFNSSSAGSPAAPPR